MSIDQRRAAQKRLEGEGLLRSGGETTLQLGSTVVSDPRLLATILDAGISPNTRGSDGETILMIAVRNDYRDLRDRLILEGTTLDAQDSEGTTALMWASIRRRPDSTRRLLNAKARPNLKTKEGWTALMYAAASGDASIVNMLLRSRADASLVNELGWSARDVARIRHFDAIAQILPATAAPAAPTGKLRVGNFLTTQSSIDFGTVAEGSHAERTIEFRLDAGSPPQRLALSIDPPFSVEPGELFVTTAGPQSATIRVEATSAYTCLERSLRVSPSTDTSSVPVQACVGLGKQLDLVALAAPYRRLLDSPGKRDSKLELLQTALQQAAGAGDIVTIQALLSAGVSPDFVSEGLTPLTLAVKNNEPGAVKALIDGGADVHLKGTRSALEWVRSSANGECSLVLRKGGARE